jgi:hypothetical protein
MGKNNTEFKNRDLVRSLQVTEEDRDKLLLERDTLGNERRKAVDSLAILQRDFERLENRVALLVQQLADKDEVIYLGEQ